MNKNTKILAIVFFVILIVFLIISSYQSKNEPKQESPITDKFRTEDLGEQNEVKKNLVGGDRDEHGCIPSAGYTWCEAKSSCIRPWESFCTSATPKNVTFICENGKNINATFYIKDDKYVDLKLSDGRNISVPKAISASGARYATENEEFVFWNKGDTAFITEGKNGDLTFKDCALPESKNIK